MHIHNRITLGKIIISVGLLSRLVFLLLPLVGVGLFLENGTAYVVSTVIQTCLVAGGLVVYALEPRDAVQRIFATVGACTALLMLVSTSAAYLPMILFFVQMASIAMLTLTSRRMIRNIVGIIALLLSIAAAAAVYTGIIPTTALKVVITAFCYVSLAVGMYL